MKTSAEYKESLRKMKPNIYKFGELIEDVTTHPAITRSLKGLDKELDIPILVCSQLSRAVEKREAKRPQLSDLRDSGAIEQDADLVLMLHRPNVIGTAEEEDFSEDQDDGTVELIVAKNRNGPTGILNLVFLKEYTSFHEKSDEKPLEFREES